MHPIKRRHRDVRVIGVGRRDNDGFRPAIKYRLRRFESVNPPSVSDVCAHFCRGIGDADDPGNRFRKT